MSNYHLTRKSSNAKTGNMAVSTSNKATCPDSCLLKKNGCYADNFHLNFHWDKVSSGERGSNWNVFLKDLKSLPSLSAFRHNQAGDLVGVLDTIDQNALQELTRATKKLRSFTYTHYPMLGHVDNQKAVKLANDNGFTVNLSANNIEDVDALVALNIAPVAVLMPKDAKKVTRTKAGTKIVICPAQTSKKTTCSSCLLCADAKRDYVIGFLAHGTGAKKAMIATNNI